MSTETITYHCDECGQPVAGRDGWVTLDERQAHETATRRRQWGQDNPGPSYNAAALILDYPEGAPWRVYHADCDPGPDGYWFHVGEVDTPGGLLDWTLHLLGKPWFEDTDWPEFVRRHTGRADA